MTSYYAPEKSRLVVHCNASSASWQLTCRGIQWDGKIGNCSHPTLSSAASGDTVQDNVGLQALMLNPAILKAVGVIVSIYLKESSKTMEPLLTTAMEGAEPARWQCTDSSRTIGDVTIENNANNCFAKPRARVF